MATKARPLVLSNAPDYALGSLLRDLRRAKGLTLTILAKMTGLSP